MRMLTILTLSLIVATGAMAQGVSIADFEGTNDGNWTWGNAADMLHAAGGNPDGWFGNDYINNFAPILRCENNAPGWTGNLYGMRANRISGDFQTLGAGTEYMQYYPLTFMFRNQMGTPNDIEDDIHVYPDPYFFGSYSPDVGIGWQHTSFDIPVDFEGAPGELPEGWSGGSYLTGNASFPTDATWQDVMGNVDKIEIWFFHPDEFGILTWFDMGADNIMLEWLGGPVATEDSSFGSVKALFR